MTIVTGPFARWEEIVVIQQPNQSPLAEILAASDGGKRISRNMMYAIVAAGLLHAGLAFYLYKQRTTVPETAYSEPPVITIARPRLPEPPRPRPTTKEASPPRPNLHPPVPTDAPRPDTTPFVVDPNPQPTPGPITDVAPEPQPPQPAPPGPKAEPAKPEGPATIVDPKWVSKPTADQMQRAYPPRAATLDKSGHVTMQCSVLASGKVTGCAVASEDPVGYGFGSAALSLAKYFKMSPQTRGGAVIDGARVTLRLAFTLN